jgi:hypothetical protein
LTKTVSDMGVAVGAYMEVFTAIFDKLLRCGHDIAESIRRTQNKSEATPHPPHGHRGRTWPVAEADTMVITCRLLVARTSSINPPPRQAHVEHRRTERSARCDFVLSLLA